MRACACLHARAGAKMLHRCVCGFIVAAIAGALARVRAHTSRHTSQRQTHTHTHTHTISQNQIFRNEKSWKDTIWGRLNGENVNRHQSLFWFGQNGEAVMMHLVKLVLFSTCVNIAVFFVEVRPAVMQIKWAPFGSGESSADTLIATWAVRVLLFGVACCLPYMTLTPMPVCIGYLNLTTAVEMMKKEKEINQVIMTQKYEMHEKATHVLATLQYFLEIGQSVGDIEGNATAVAAEQSKRELYLKLCQGEDAQRYVETLRDIFHRFDVDGSGSIDEDELGPLLACMGQSKSETELKRLFNLMDVDGSGDVDFEEFATVMLSSRKGRRKVAPDELAERLYAIFDTDGDGTIDTDETIKALKELGRTCSGDKSAGYTWDTDDVQAFLEEIDTDHSGTITKDEFIAYVQQFAGEHHS